MQVESSLAGVSGFRQNGIRPQGPAFKRFLIVQQYQLDETRQRNIHIITGRKITVIACMAGVDILPRGFFDNTAQGHIITDKEPLMCGR